MKKGLKVWFDKNNIPLAVDFQTQINDGIEKAHNFIFIIAPHSVKSSYCSQEIELAVKYNKRIIPILHVNSDSYLDVMHPTIRKLNWLFMSEDPEVFEKGFTDLLQLINHHSDYVKQHTKFLNKALKWLRTYKQTQYLLFNHERNEAESWLKKKFEDEQAPCEPTELHCEYITESIRNANNLMTDVFIGYTSSEQKIAQKISYYLRRESLTVVLEELSAYKKFPEQSLIEADNGIYIISNTFLLSGLESKAFDPVFRYHKRIFALVTDKIILNKMETQIREREIIELTDLDNLNLGISELIKKIQEDEYYYKQHKMLLTKALKWQLQNYNPSLLLRGYNLQHYQSWMKIAKNHPDHPPIDLQVEFIGVSSNQPPDSSIEVFISYCPKDIDFARKINENLQELGKTTWFDQENIVVEKEGRQEIYQGIANSDNFVLIISPDSITSSDCAEEFNYAKQLNKRIIPILDQEIDPLILHPDLKKIAKINFNQNERDFLANFNELVRTIHLDRDHVHSHTKWLQKAREWELSQKNPDLLLRITEFSLAKNWLLESEQEDKKPPATALQKEYIQASESAIIAAQKAEKERQEEIIRLQKERTQEAEARLIEQKKRIKIQNGLLVSAILAFCSVLGLGLETYYQYQISIKNEIKALTAYSLALFSQGFELEALTQAIKAGEKLKQLNKTDVDVEVETALKEIIFRITESNQLVRHKGDILTVKFSPNGQKIATGSADNTIKLWAIDGRLIKTLSKHRGSVNTLAFRPDGQLLASGSVDNTIILWQADGTYLSTLSGHKNEVTSLNFSSDGQGLVSSSRDKTIKLWKRNEQGKNYREFKSIKVDDKVNTVTFSPDDRFIVSGHDSGKINLWKLDGTFLKTIGSHQDRVTKIVFSPNSQLLASSSFDGTIQIWQQEPKNLTDYLKTQTLTGDGSRVWDIAITTNLSGQYILLAGFDDTINLWKNDGIKWNLIFSEYAHQAKVRAVAVSPHIKLKNTETMIFASASADNTVQLWNPDRSKLLKLGFSHDKTILAVDISPDNRLIASASLDKTIKLWTIKDNLTNIKTLRGHQESVNGIKISPDGQFMASASSDNTVKLWTIDGKLLKTLHHDDDVYDVDISSDSQWIVSGSRDQTIKIWGRDGTLKKILRKHTDGVRTVAISPDGQLIASGSSDDTVKIWRFDGTLLTTLSDHQSPVLGVDFSSDSQKLISGGEDHIIKLWTRDSFNKFSLNTTFANNFSKNSVQNNQSILNLKFSPNNQLIASASNDGIIRFWDLNGNYKAIYPGHENEVYGINFSRDGKLMVSGGADKAVILWNLTENISLAQLLQHGCHWLRNYLSNNPPSQSENICQEFNKTS